MAAFPGADAGLQEAAYAIVGAPLDVSTTFRPGARFGPERIRRFARAFDDYDRRTSRRFGDLVADDGDLEAWDDAAEYLQFLEGELASGRRSRMSTSVLTPTSTSMTPTPETNARTRPSRGGRSKPPRRQSCSGSEREVKPNGIVRLRPM